MSLRYVAVNWNRQKRIYDGAIVAGVAASVAVFSAVTFVAHPDAIVETVLIRGFGLTGFLLLHLILAIGPLARLDRRFLPLLYNRRHLGVATALVGATHAVLVMAQYHAFGVLHPLVSALAGNPDYGSWARFPFELFGLGALVILVLMAATSHDYWLSALTPPTWKRLHMLVYVAYGALVAHVALGVLQDERGGAFALALAVGITTIGGLHLAAGFRERAGDRDRPAERGWVDVGAAGDVPEGRALVATVAGERVAVFRHEGRLSAVSNVCKHQNGPLGEGRIVDGCITCPWHGYQYLPESGASPPPFTDSVPTFHLRVERGRVLVHERPNPPGTRVEPQPADPASPPPMSEFYVGYAPTAPPATARFVRRLVVTLAASGLGLVAALAVAQATYEPATFEFGRSVALDGVVRATPYPMLEVARPGLTEQVSRYLLAGSGKHGAQPLVAGLDGRSVRVAATLAYRGNLTLLDLAQVAALPDNAASPGAAPIESRGRFELTGEIVDSKCYIGVMNPGLGKAHRSCAALCLAGGLTPLFVVDDSAGRRVELLIVDSAGAPIQPIARWAGRPLRVAGRVARQGDLWLLYADPSGFRAPP